LSPSYFGANCYTCNSTRISTIKRVYFYLYTDKIEPCFYGAKYRYTVKINAARLYDLCADTLSLAELLKGNDIFAELKKRGYIGAIGNNGISCACLFYDIKINSQETLTK